VETGISTQIKASFADALRARRTIFPSPRTSAETDSYLDSLITAPFQILEGQFGPYEIYQETSRNKIVDTSGAAFRGAFEFKDILLGSSFEMSKTYGKSVV